MCYDHWYLIISLSAQSHSWQVATHLQQTHHYTCRLCVCMYYQRRQPAGKVSSTKGKRAVLPSNGIVSTQRFERLLIVRINPDTNRIVKHMNGYLVVVDGQLVGVVQCTSLQRYSGAPS